MPVSFYGLKGVEMANTRTRKTTATKKVEPVVEAVEVSTETVEAAEPVKTQVAKKKEFEENTPILCTSITCGELRMEGIKSGMQYVWLDRGDSTEVEYQDLVAAIRVAKMQVMSPCFIIEDEDFVEKYPKLKEIYGNIYSVGDLRKIITELDAQSMKLTIMSLPEGARNSVKNIAATMVQNGQFDDLSIAKIKVLDELYGTNLLLLSDLMQ